MVPLDRRFIPWTDKDEGDPEVMSYLLASRDAFTWKDLLAKHRAVILAEAGSGKSTEMAEQVRLSLAAGRYTFFATVQSVGRRGLISALGRAAAARLEQWRISDQPAWFFFDSVDEAKARDVRLDDALREIADGIEGGASRAHIVLSGRHTDWEFKRDLEYLNKWIAMPPDDSDVSAVDPNELIISVIRRDKPPETPEPAEAPIVVLMGALNRKQVEAFARGKGVANVDGFFGALDKASLWDFARRPLDLDWLVGFWRTHRRLGSLAEMLELSLRQRLAEPDPQRARTDPIDTDRAMIALERIGSALVLQRLRDIVVPDTGIDLSGDRDALDLAEILPDWSGEHRARLITRAVFDPARAGFARLHNDNQGSVRSFLAARWLKRLMDSNCPQFAVTNLLFATTYGLPVVIPSMRQTAAWLALWNRDVAREVVTRDPKLLMDAGDPGSLPLIIREQALKAIVAQIIDDENIRLPSRDHLKRFASLDIAPCLQKIWAAHSGSPAVRELLLVMISLGELTCCADIAVSAAFGTYTDEYTQVFSGRALIATASELEKRRYIDYLKENAGTVPRVLIWDAIDALFPILLSIDDFLLMLKSIDPADGNRGLGLSHYGPIMADRLVSAAQAQELLAGLLGYLINRFKPLDEQELPHDEALATLIEAVGRRLLELVPQIFAPPLAIDAAVRVVEFRHRYWRRKIGEGDLFALLQATPERRRLTLWCVAEQLARAPILEGKPITDTWYMGIVGFAPELQPSDVDWLLDDAEHRPAKNERQIAANAVLRLWRGAGENSDLLMRLKNIGSVHPEVAETIEEWTRPRSESEMERAQRREIRRIDRQNALAQAKVDQSWRDFADRLRADPDQLRSILPPTEKGADARLYHLWQLLDAVGSNRSRHAIEDLTPLEPMFGAAVVSALRDAFIGYWRHWSPTLRSERPSDRRNMISALDCIGIVGVTLEAAAKPAWAITLPYKDAVRAAIYATLELNGLPVWLTDLAQAQPDAVREVLKRAISPELAAGAAITRAEALETISHADVVVSSLLADVLFDHLSENELLPAAIFAPAMRILEKGYHAKGTLESLLRSRFDRAVRVEEAAMYLPVLFKLNPARAIDALEAKLSGLTSEERPFLVGGVLSTLFGGRWDDGDVHVGGVPFEIVERLTQIAFRTIRVNGENSRPGGKSYSSVQYEQADGARQALFHALVNTPGVATFDAIYRLSDIPEFPISRQRMVEIARNRAESDSESEPWSSIDVCEFEVDFLTVPRNPFDLQRLALYRLGDLQHDLLNSDYAQGAVVAQLEKEVAIQNWIADRLRAAQGRSYSIEREPHVAEEKEPDIRFRAKASDANVPMEIKVAESWSLAELEDALKVQLIDRYLRDRHNRYGILLLVHQRARPKGWRSATGEWLNFVQVLEHLRTAARLIAGESPNAPQVEIAVIDVSSIAAATCCLSNTR